MSVIPERLKFTQEFLLYLNVVLFLLLQCVPDYFKYTAQPRKKAENRIVENIGKKTEVFQYGTETVQTVQKLQLLMFMDLIPQALHSWILGIFCHSSQTLSGWMRNHFWDLLYII